MRTTPFRTLALAALALGFAAGASIAQPSGGGNTPTPAKKPIKKSPTDLEGEARRPREGQVTPATPGEQPPPAPAPATASPPAPAPPPAPTPALATQPPPPHPTPPAPAPRQPDKPKAATPASPAPKQTSGIEPPTRTPAPTRSSVEPEVRFVAVDRVQVTFVGVGGDAAQAQWRAVDEGGGKPGAWTAIQVGETVEDRVEIRTGLGVSVELKLADAASLQVSHLARLRIERKIRSDGTWQLGALLSRGELRIQGLQKDEMGFAKAPVHVRTPDGTYPIRTHTSIAYDAFNGTTTEDLNNH